MTKPSITKRSVKGAALTYNELDANFQNLKDATISLTAGSGGTAVVSDLNGNITLVAGSNVTISGDNSAKTITIAASGGGSNNTFSTIAVSGQSNVVADSTSDTLTLVAGSNITLTTNATTDTITIAATSGGITDIVQDTTPQLGGDLDTNGKTISDSSGRVTVADELIINSGINIGYLAGSAYRIESNDGLIIASETTFGGSVAGPSINLSNGIYGGTTIIGKDNVPNDKIYLSDVVNIGSLTTSQRNALSNPQNGDIIYNSSTNALQGYVNGAWANLSSATDAGTLTGSTLASGVTASSLTSVGTLTGLTVSGTGAITYNASGSGQALSITAKNTVGGTSYADFLKVTNSASGATTPNKTFRLNSTGTLELINSAYTATLLTVSDAGIITVPGTASVSSNAATNNALAIGSHGQIFDDGNLHIHTSDGSLWLNSLTGGDIQLGIQSNSGSSNVKANGTFYMNSGYGSVAPVYGVRAWISCGYNGTTMQTYASGNLSVSRSSTGVYVFTFGSAMPDGNYAINATAQVPGSNSDVAVNVHYNTAISAYTFTLATARYGTGFEDVPHLTVSVIR